MGKIILTITYLIFGIIFSFPLISNFDTAIPRSYFVYSEELTSNWGDYVQYYTQSIEHKNLITNIITGKTIYEKEGCLESDISKCKEETFILIKKIIFSPFWIFTLTSLIIGNIAAFNLNVLLNFVFIGLCGYYLAKLFIKPTAKINFSFFNFRISDIVALCASLFVILPSKRLIHLFGGQRIGYLFFLLVLVIFFFEKELKTKKTIKTRLLNKYKNIIYIFVILVFLGLTEQFLMLYSLIYIALRVLWYEFITQKKHIIFSFDYLLMLAKRYAWIPITTLIILGLNSLSTLKNIGNSQASNGREWINISDNSGSMFDLWANKNLGFETNMYLGFGIAILIMALFVSINYIIERKKVPLMLFFVILSLICIIISLGSNTPVYKFLYDNLPTFKYSRTPTRAIFLVYPLLIILVAQIHNYFKHHFFEFKINKYVTLIISVIVSVICTMNFYTVNRIDLIYLPQFDKQYLPKPETGKILFLPMSFPEDPFGSSFEYYLSFGDALSINTYNPFPKQADQLIVDEYGEVLNTGGLKSEQFTNFLTKNTIASVFLIKRDFNQPLLYVESRENNLEATKEMLDNCTSLEKTYSDDVIDIYSYKN